MLKFPAFILLAALAFTLAFFLVQFLMWQGQWIVERVRGRGPQFRRRLYQWVTTQGKLTQLLIQLGGLYGVVFLLQNRGKGPYWDHLSVVLPIMLIGLLAGMGRGLLSAPPARWMTTATVTIAAISGSWLVKTSRLQFDHSLIITVFAPVVIVLALNGFVSIRGRFQRPQKLLLDLNQLLSRNLRVEHLMKDGEILSKPGTPYLNRLAQGSLVGIIGGFKVHVTEQGLNIMLIQSDPVNDSDMQLVPGCETQELVVMWIQLDRSHLQLKQTQSMIGYSETTLLLKNSGAKLRLTGLSRKHLKMINGWHETPAMVAATV